MSRPVIAKKYKTRLPQGKTVFLLSWTRLHILNTGRRATVDRHWPSSAGSRSRLRSPTRAPDETIFVSRYTKTTQFRSQQNEIIPTIHCLFTAPVSSAATDELHLISETCPPKGCVPGEWAASLKRRAALLGRGDCAATKVHSLRSPHPPGMARGGARHARNKADNRPHACSHAQSRQPCDERIST